VSERRIEWVQLPLRSQAVGQPVVVAVAEPTLREFVEGIPDVLPDPTTRCFELMGLPEREELKEAWERWVDEMLARTIVTPAWLKTPDRVRQLGPDRDALGQVALTAWGVRTEVPFRKNFVWMVRRLAKALRLPPTDLLEWPAGKFWLNYALMFADEDGPDG
jgi:hypothetical protein